jgi:hypothetical protein
MFFETTYNKIANVMSVDTRKDIAWVSIALIGLCLCSYIYFATQTVRNIVAKEDIAIQSQDISQKLSSKEFALISLQNNITLDYAASLGFTDAKNKVFISPSRVSFVSDSTNGNTL